MNPQRFHTHLRVALKTPDIRRACAAVERLYSAIDLLDNLPEEALEDIRDYCDEYNKGRKNAFSDFKRGYIELVVAHLNDLRLRERRLYHAITGSEDIQERNGHYGVGEV